MRKLLLVSVIGLLLVGCGEDKVTDAMLAGEWDCTTTSYKTSWIDGQFGELAKIGNVIKNKINLKYEDSKLFIYNKDKDEWVAGSFVNEYNGEDKKEETDTITSIYNQSIAMKGRDTFLLSHKLDLISKNDNFSNHNSRRNDETICTRIK